MSLWIGEERIEFKSIQALLQSEKARLLPLFQYFLNKWTTLPADLVVHVRLIWSSMRSFLPSSDDHFVSLASAWRLGLQWLYAFFWPNQTTIATSEAFLHDFKLKFKTGRNPNSASSRDKVSGDTSLSSENVELLQWSWAPWRREETRHSMTSLI